MNRQRVTLEVITAVLLGLVSVATAFSAYQAANLTQEASELASISQQLRDRNLTVTLSTQISLRDDSRRVTEAFALQSDLLSHPETLDEVRAQQHLLVAAASPALREAWVIWEQSDFDVSTIPLADPSYVIALYAPPQSLQYASFDTDRMVDRVSARAHQQSGAAVLFGLALFVLGVAGVLANPRTTIVLVASGGVVFLMGLVVSLAGS